MPNVNLSDAEWGQVMEMISRAPWREANPLLMKIGDQLRAQHMPQGNAKNYAPDDKHYAEDGHEQPH